MKIVIIVQAGKKLLKDQLEQLKRVTYADDIVVATTTSKIDDSIVDLCKQLKINYFRGSERDVLDCYYQAAEKYQADVIVRVSSDCPLIDPAIVDQTIAYYLRNSSNYDYVSSGLVGIEVFSFQVLEDAHAHALLPAEREHVTLFINSHQELFRSTNLTSSNK